MDTHKVFRLLTGLIVLGVLSGASIEAVAAAPATPPGAWTCWDDGTPDPCHNDLNSVDAISPSQVWAVGSYGTMLRWNGSAWTKISSPTSAYLQAVDMVSASDGWAVGSSGTILRWNGATWSVVASPVANDLLDVSMLTAADGWAVVP